MTEPTSSTSALAASIRTHLLSFREPSGPSMGDTLGAKLYQERAPDGELFPYAVQRLSSSGDGQLSGMRRQMQLEVQLYGRPFAQQRIVNDLADLCEQAMLFYLASTQGLVYAAAPTSRSTLPVAGAPADGETITVRLVFTLLVWPQYLTRLTTE